jgi:hypothetical protein
MSTIIQCLWIGRALSPLEQLSIRSFLANGHEVHLYLYEQAEGVPRGTRVRNAERVLPRSAQFLYRDHPSYAGFSNFFRYRLLLEKGGWFVDLDNICLRPFDFTADYVFSSEDVLEGGTKANVGATKVPAGCELMADLWPQCEAFDVSTLAWGECGPKLMAQAIRRHGLDKFVQPPRAFCPLPWWDWRNVLDPDADCDPPEATYAIHLWNEMWRRAGVDKFAEGPAGSLYARLQDRFPAGRELVTGRSRLGWSRTWGRLKKYSRSLAGAQKCPKNQRQLETSVEDDQQRTSSSSTGLKQSPTRISAVVLTKNGEQRIERCLRSILDTGFADEIVVCIDRATADNTYEIARSLADHVHFVTTDGYLESALPQMVALCSGDFILRLDDDERLGGNWARPDFESLVALNDLSHLTVLRRWIVDDGHNFIADSPWFPDVQMRLFRNVPASIRWPVQIHEPMEIAGNCLTLGDRWIEHDVLFTATAAERQEKCRSYQALRPTCHLSHYYWYEEREVARLPANQQGFRAAMQRLSAERSGSTPPAFPYCELGEDIRFEAGQIGGRHTLSGWSAAESWGTWTDARCALLQFYFRAKPPESLLFVVDARAYTCASHPAQSVSVECQGETLGLWSFDSDDFENRSVVVPHSALTGGGSLTIYFQLLNPASPEQLGESDDPRLLGMALRSVRIEVGPPSAAQTDVAAAELAVAEA